MTNASAAYDASTSQNGNAGRIRFANGSDAESVATCITYQSGAYAGNPMMIGSTGERCSSGSASAAASALAAMANGMTGIASTFARMDTKERFPVS